MNHKQLIILLVVILSACGTRSEGNPTNTSETSIATRTPTVTNPIAPPPETIAAPSRVADPTATVDKRLPPERWQEWPVIPSVTARSIEIYQAGQSMGLDPHAFSKVGDCQSVKAAFMGYFDIPERYSLGNDYAYLQQTVENFAGHFNTDGQAVKGGFNAAAVLSPLWADPNVCLAGENPLECELRVTKPIIAIVSLEVWWEGRSSEQYENLIRRILDTIIAHGAVPILATKADNIEGDNSLNLTTARLAYQYDLPLWNFWAAVQHLPDHGMDMTRKDGFHISTQAWSTRSFTGLEALDNIWRGLQAVSNIKVNPVELTATPNDFPSFPLESSPVATVMANGVSTNNSEHIVFGIANRQSEVYKSLGVYLLDMTARQNKQIFGAGIVFQSASPDGKYLLVSEGPNLYRTNINGTHALLLSDSMYSYSYSGAIWLSNEQIAVILTKSNVNGIYIISASGEQLSELHIQDESPVELYPSSNSSHIYWTSGSCSSLGVCQTDAAWVTSLDGILNQALIGQTHPKLSPDNTILASGVDSTAEQNELIFSAKDGTSPKQLLLPGNNLVDYAWTPKGDALAVVMSLRSEYSGKVTGNRNFVVIPQTLDVIEYPQTIILNPRVLWSPDGTSLFWIGTESDQNGFKITGSLVTRTEKVVTDMSTAINLTAPDYLVVTNAAWLPFP